MDISPLADKQQRNNSRNNNRRPQSEEGSRLDEYSSLHSNTSQSREILSVKRIQALIEQLNRISGSADISFEIMQPVSISSNSTIVEVMDTKQEELLLELTMRDLVEIEKQINEDSVEDITEFMCGSFFSLTA